MLFQIFCFLSKQIQNLIVTKMKKEIHNINFSIIQKYRYLTKENKINKVSHKKKNIKGLLSNHTMVIQSWHHAKIVLFSWIESHHLQFEGFVRHHNSWLYSAMKKKHQYASEKFIFNPINFSYYWLKILINLSHTYSLIRPKLSRNLWNWTFFIV